MSAPDNGVASREGSVRILLACAGGGFATEIEALLSGFETHENIVFAFPRVEARPLIKRFGAKHFFVMRAVYHSREAGLKRSPAFWISAIRRCARKVRLSSPDIAIFFGAADSIPLIFACRLLGIKCVFIESLARIHSLSLTGRIVYHLRLSDHFLVQWPSLAKTYPRAVYEGAVYDLRHGRVDVF